MSKDVVVVDGCKEEKGTFEENENKSEKEKVRRISKYLRATKFSRGKRER